MSLNEQDIDRQNLLVVLRRSLFLPHPQMKIKNMIRQVERLKNAALENPPMRTNKSAL